MDKPRDEKRFYQNDILAKDRGETPTYDFKSTREKFSRDSTGMEEEEKWEDYKGDGRRAPIPQRMVTYAVENPWRSFSITILAGLLILITTTLILHQGTLSSLETNFTNLKDDISILQNENSSNDELASDLEKLRYRVDVIEDKIASLFRLPFFSN